jgi:protein-L-isoaspartate(D-aspartate) O-methyltransferase
LVYTKEEEAEMKRKEPIVIFSSAVVLVVALAVVLFSLVPTPRAASWDEPKEMRQRRFDMVSRQIAARGIRDKDVLEAMRSVPRHLFVPQAMQERAYVDSPLPIDAGQTISQPYIVALMTELLDLEPQQRILEIGTGSGYQAAVLSTLVEEVFSIEIKEILHHQAAERLEELGYGNVRTRHGDGYFGWEEEAPFDGIMITASVDHVPPPLLEQLADGGKIVLPLGHPFSFQNLVVVTKEGEDYRLRQVTGVLFVPMTGKAMEKY